MGCESRGIDTKGYEGGGVREPMWHKCFSENPLPVLALQDPPQCVFKTGAFSHSATPPRKLTYQNTTSSDDLVRGVGYG